MMARERMLEPECKSSYITEMTRPMRAVQRTRTAVETSSHLATRTSIIPVVTQAVMARTTPTAYVSSVSTGSI